MHTTIAAIVASALSTMCLQPEAPKPAPSPAPTKDAPSVPAHEQPNPAINPTPREKANQGWWDRHAKICESITSAKTSGDADLLFVGDSITEGWGGAGAEAWKQNYDKRHAINFGISGDRTQHVLWRLANSGLQDLNKPVAKDGHAPRLVVVMIGTNNTDTDSPEQIDAGVRAVAAALREKLPQTKVLVLGIFPRSELPADKLRKKVVLTNKLLKDINVPGVSYLDIGDQFLGKDGRISRDIMPDFLHLSPKGYDIWAKAIEPKVHELLGEK